MHPRRAAALLVALCACALLGTASTTARAEPSVWTLAARPSTMRRERLFRTVDELLGEHLHSTRAASALRRSLALKRAQRLLDRAGAARSRDPLLRYRHARVLHALYDLDREASLLRGAAASFAFVADSDLPLTLRAEVLNDLAICYARLGDHEREIDAYTRALRIEPHPETRAILLANRAEGYMVRGKIEHAVRGYRQSLAITPSALSHRLSVTTHWGLAVALDRAGDLEQAMEQIATARSYDPVDERIHGPNWFYIPEYDDSWYHALGHWQRARASSDATERGQHFEQAVRSWKSYLERAAPKDRWLELASRRLRQCERESRLALPRRRPKPKPEAPTGDDDEPPSD
jgi:tetratricopeptide (TPR) repeat protein